MSTGSILHCPEDEYMTTARDYVTRVTEDVIARAERQIDGCERCDASSDTRFGAMLRFFGEESSAEYYVLARSGSCPACQSALDEHTRVRWD